MEAGCGPDDTVAAEYAPVACEGTWGKEGGAGNLANGIGGAEAGPIPGPIAPASWLKTVT